MVGGWLQQSSVCLPRHRRSEMGRVESAELTGTGRSRRDDKESTLEPAVYPFADIHGVAGRLREGRIGGGQREFASSE
jgi:hypothetical protein